MPRHNGSKHCKNIRLNIEIIRLKFKFIQYTKTKKVQIHTKLEHYKMERKASDYKIKVLDQNKQSSNSYKVRAL
jgi:hypothetical protein